MPRSCSSRKGFVRAHLRCRRDWGPASGSEQVNNSQPDLRCTPAIIRFLGHNSLLAANTLAEQLVRQRASLGLSQKEPAKRLGVDPSKLAKWKREEREPTGTLAGQAAHFLADGEATSLPSAARIA